ncbi:nitrilase-related carbon-nitrogen hydrolase [Leucobacter triazinivorans]|uniref:CN hydrolase domain-containing protein n=1 Tax=Leucobacter triazinivorans TaxID=1784719 RepID=A0A4V0Z1Y0_9MICO|nr:nitrilase-related carbon-nitrogen hydrolase [Leucobacter triazinivorans]QBE49979.1 hypothetical protein EVS81_15025 [Leucobacter triazinivorans]
MNRNARNGQALLRIAAAGASGILLAWSYGLHPWWGAAWLAPIPLLVAVAPVRWWVAVVLGALAGAIGSVSLLRYLIELGGVLDALSMSMVRSAQWAGMALVARLAMTRLPAWLGIFVMPAMIAGFEVVAALLSPHGSGGSLAYSQMDALPVIQVASIGGTAAVAFLPMLFANTVASVILRRAWVWRAAIAPALVLLLALGFGGWRTSVPVAGEDARVALIAIDRFKGIPRGWEETWAVYGPEIADAVESGAKIVVLPEKLFTITTEERDAFLDEAHALARKHGIDLVIGVDERGESARNRAYLISHTGVARHYDKRHLVPGFESHFAPGSGSLVAQSAGLGVGVAICKDMDFPGTIRGHDVAVMLVPAWDFGEDAWFHSRIAMLRGVENGVVVARSARDGLLTVSDANGRVLAETSSAAEPRTIVEGLPNRPGEATLYSTIGEAFGWACFVFAFGAVGVPVIRRRPSPPASSDDMVL